MKNLKYPKPTSPALLRSALAQAREAGSWPGSLQGVYDPRRAAEGPRSVNLCILEYAGPRCAANGPYPRCPSLPTRLREEVGYYVFWYKISSTVNSSRDSPHQEGCAVCSTDRQCWVNDCKQKWMFLYNLLTFPSITIAGEIALSGGNTRVWIKMSFLLHWAWF